MPKTKEDPILMFRASTVLAIISSGFLFTSPCRGYIYDIAEIPPLVGKSKFVATSMNNGGTVAGYSFTGSQHYPAISMHPYTEAVQYTQKEEFLDEYKSSQLLGINDATMAAGNEFINWGAYSGISFAYRWAPGGQSREFLEPLGVPDATRYGMRAIDINNSGQVVGYSSYSSSSLGSGRKAVIWNPGTSTPIDLGFSNQSQVLKINNKGQLIGLDGERAFFYNGGPTFIPDYIHQNEVVESVSALNDNGTVVGRSNGRTFIWNAQTGSKRLDLGSNGLTPSDINNHDMVTGRWAGNAMRGSLNMGFSKLTDRIAPGTSWQLTDAAAINDNGQILGTGKFNGVEKTFVLTPRVTPEQVLNLLRPQLARVSREKNVSSGWHPRDPLREKIEFSLDVSPLNLSMKEAAEVLGYHHFNFINRVIHEPSHWKHYDVNGKEVNVPFFDPVHTVRNATQSTIYSSVPKVFGSVPYVDRNGQPVAVDDKPFYYNEGIGGPWDRELFESNMGQQFRFHDAPSTNPNFVIPGDYVRFSTELVGVFNDGNWESLPLPKVRWSDSALHNPNGHYLGSGIFMFTLPGADLPPVVSGGIFDVQVIPVSEPASLGLLGIVFVFLSAPLRRPGRRLSCETANRPSKVCCPVGIAENEVAIAN